jgi:hypothetical protein
MEKVQKPSNSEHYSHVSEVRGAAILVLLKIKKKELEPPPKVEPGT